NSNDWRSVRSFECVRKIYTPTFKDPPELSASISSTEAGSGFLVRLPSCVENERLFALALISAELRLRSGHAHKKALERFEPGHSMARRIRTSVVERLTEPPCSIHVQIFSVRGNKWPFFYMLCELMNY